MSGIGQAAREERDERRVAWALGGTLAVLWGFLAVALILVWKHTIFPAGVLLSLASLSCGGIVGFIFGIPRAATSAASEPKTATAPANPHSDAPGGESGPKKPLVRVNTNLEDVSDWLTKIIIGLGIANLAALNGQLRSLGETYGPAFGKAPVGNLMVICATVFFAVWGFLVGYVLTRLFLQKQFAEGDLETGQIGAGFVGPAALPVNLPVKASGDAVTAAVIGLAWTSFRRKELDKQFARESGGLPIYQFEVALVAAPNALEKVRQVTYTIPGWPAESSPRVVTDRQTRFKLKDLAWGSPFVTARIEIEGQPDPLELSCVVPLLEAGPRV